MKPSITAEKISSMYYVDLCNKRMLSLFFWFLASTYYYLHTSFWINVLHRLWLPKACKPVPFKKLSENYICIVSNIRSYGILLDFFLVCSQVRFVHSHLPIIRSKGPHISQNVCHPLCYKFHMTCSFAVKLAHNYFWFIRTSLYWLFTFKVRLVHFRSIQPKHTYGVLV